VVEKPHTARGLSQFRLNVCMCDKNYDSGVSVPHFVSINGFALLISLFVRQPTVSCLLAT
jgi:hypothetical protein